MHIVFPKKDYGLICMEEINFQQNLDGSVLKLTQETNYPWDGNIKVTIDEAPVKSFSIFMRIPGWAGDAKILVNGKPYATKQNTGYVEIDQ